MADAIIVKKSAGSVEIAGQEIISGTFQETISKFNSVKMILGTTPNPDIAKITTSPLPSRPNFRSNGAAYSSDGTYLAVACDSGNRIAIWKQVGETFTRLSDPLNNTSTTGGFGVAFSPNGDYLAHAVQTEGSFSEPNEVFKIFKRNVDTFTKLPAPASLPVGNVSRAVAFSADGVYFATGTGGGVTLRIYKRSGDTFNSLSNPSVMPPSTVLGLAFSPNGDYLSVAHRNSPFITIYKRSGDTFTKLANPATLPNHEFHNGMGTDFSPDNNYLAIITQISPWLIIYKRNGDTFTKLADPDVLPNNSNPSNSPGTFGSGVSFSANGTYLACAHMVSPFVSFYKRNGDVFSKLPDVETIPIGTGNGIAFRSDNNYILLAHGTPNFVVGGVTVYKDGLPKLISKANNLLDTTADELGYALEDGTTNETKTMMSLFREE